MRRPAVIAATFALVASIAAHAALVPAVEPSLAPVAVGVSCAASASAFYDTSLQACGTCPQYTVSGTTTTCACSTGLRQTGVVCATCTSSQIPSNDGTFCLSCPLANPIKTVTIGATTISTCSCSQGQYLVDRDPTGAPLTTGICTACASGYYPSQDLATCLACPDTANMVATQSGSTYTCTCKTGGSLSATPLGNTCLTQSSIALTIATYGTTQSAVTFRDIIDAQGNAATVTIDSDTFTENYLKSITKCSIDGSITHCDMLANLCVLTMYDQSHGTCSAYLKLARTRQSTRASPYDDQPQGLPWLYYGITNRELPQSTSTHVPDIVLDTSGLSGVASLPLVLGVYALNGSFVGYQSLTSQFIWCKTGNSGLPSSWAYVGYNFAVSCPVNLYDVVRFGYDTYFYELYVKQTSGVLYPVPIRITNYRYSGTQPNANPSGTDWTGNQLTRRFTLLDTVTGTLNGAVKVVRVPTTMVLWINKVSDQAGKIKLPILDITYTERETTSISEKDTSTVSTPLMSFSVNYTQDTSKLRQDLMIVFSVMTSAVVVYAFYTTRLWSVRHLGPYDAIDLRFLVRFILAVCGNLGPVIGTLTYVVCVYFFVFFKAQGVLFVCLPYTVTDLSVLMTAIGCVVASELVHVVNVIARQCSAYVFLIDWERSRGKTPGVGQSGGVDAIADETGVASALMTSPPAVTTQPAKTATATPVSVWRSIFMANQWNALQTYRRIDIALTLIALVFLLEGFSLRKLAVPVTGLKELVDGSPNAILLVALDLSLWLGLVVAQLAWQTIILHRFYRNRMLQFIDILSLANVSLILLDSPCHGYYIHGRSVHAYADTTMDELSAFLVKEASDLVPRRGLNDTTQQSFEIFVTMKFRHALDKIQEQVTGGAGDATAATIGAITRASKLTPNRNVSSSTTQGPGTGPINPKSPLRPATETQIKQYKLVGRFLRSFLTQNLTQHTYIIRTKTYFETFLTAPDPSEGNVFFHTETAFGHALLYGVEFHLLFCFAFWFVSVHVWSGSPALSAFAVWAVDVVVVGVRRVLGERNLSRKTLLDWKFLV